MKTIPTKVELARLEEAFLETGLLNRLFMNQIKSGRVDIAYIREAFKNFQQAMHPAPAKVQKSYVLGFMFNHQEDSVLLVRKARPAWQAGKLNGVGGHIEAGETPLQAMEREFGEETCFESLVNAAGEEIRPVWKYIGKRSREALVDDQPGSYEMFIYACHFEAKACLHDTHSFNSKFHPGFKANWTSPTPVFDEPVVLAKLYKDFLNDYGVNGLSWLVDAALHALRENFILDIRDPADMSEEVVPE